RPLPANGERDLYGVVFGESRFRSCCSAFAPCPSPREGGSDQGANPNEGEIETVTHMAAVIRACSGGRVWPGDGCCPQRRLQPCSVGPSPRTASSARELPRLGLASRNARGPR